MAWKIPPWLFNLDLWQVLPHLWIWFSQHLPFPQGMYEVLAYEATLELKDSQGQFAEYRKHQKVRFLQDNIIAYQDQAWGQGDIFFQYSCSPGKPVDRYLEGDRYRVLISLRETKNKGDVETFHIERTVRNGFTQPVEYFQTKIDHTTRQLQVGVIFPAKRLPKRVVLVEHRRNITRPLSPTHQELLPDGRMQVSWQTSRPRLHEMYSLKWEW
jgi:hypothetical protein